jgi:hypothetical protein
VKNYTGGVFFDTTNATEIDHDISVVGYGIDNQTGWKYWLIRNSWGTYWVRIMLWSGFVGLHFVRKTLIYVMSSSNIDCVFVRDFILH